MCWLCVLPPCEAHLLGLLVGKLPGLPLTCGVRGRGRAPLPSALQGAANTGPPAACRREQMLPARPERPRLGSAPALLGPEACPVGAPLPLHPHRRREEGERPGSPGWGVPSWEPGSSLGHSPERHGTDLPWPTQQCLGYERHRHLGGSWVIAENRGNRKASYHRRAHAIHVAVNPPSHHHAAQPLGPSLAQSWEPRSSPQGLCRGGAGSSGSGLSVGGPAQVVGGE